MIIKILFVFWAKSLTYSSEILFCLCIIKSIQDFRFEVGLVVNELHHCTVLMFHLHAKLLDRKFMPIIIYFTVTIYI